MSFAFQARPAVDPLEREKREIQRRRQRFEDRKQRILHAKTRILGIDKDALDEQVKEKQQREQQEREHGLHYDNQSISHARTLTRLVASQQQHQRLRHEQLATTQLQQAEQKRQNDEFDKQRAKSAPSADNTLFLKFTGVDANQQRRTQLQKQQQQSWLTQQLDIQQYKQQQHLQEEKQFANLQQEIANLQLQNDAERRINERERKRLIAEYNKRLAVEKQERERQSKQHNEQLNQYELTSTLHSPILNENYSGLSSRGSITQFKGFHTSQRQRILEEQERDMELHRQRAKQEEEAEHNYATQQEAFRRELLRQERLRREHEAEARLKLKAVHLQQVKEKQERDEYLNNVVYPNRLTADFFAQFGTSHR